MSTPDRPPLPHAPAAATRTSTSHLEREIAQQPAVWRELATSLRDVGTTDLLTPVLARPDARVLLVGAGTSAYAGQVAAPHLSRVLGRRVEAVATTDLVATPRDVLVPDVPTLVVSFARSGNSPESVAACELADQLLGDVTHLVLTCNPDGALARSYGSRPGARVVLMPPGTDDRSFAMTSSFTSMVLAALLLLGGDDPGTRARVAARAGEQVLAARDHVAALAARTGTRVVHLGSGSLTGLAREAALKLTEVTAGRVLGLAESSLGFRHGPKAALTPGTLALVLVSNDDDVRPYDLDILAELADALPAGQTVAVSARELPAALTERVDVLRLDAAAAEPDAFLALPMVLVGQLLALETAGRLGLDPDVPFPGGEVNRVVRGVRIHPLGVAPQPR